ncbi:MAG: hypothetical protein LBJ92_01445 [Holosporales bacterium]|jgi:hypothetical protein|nr:hypothetical protein [Holosporales bacterium]
MKKLNFIFLLLIGSIILRESRGAHSNFSQPLCWGRRIQHRPPCAPNYLADLYAEFPNIRTDLTGPERSQSIPQSIKSWAQVNISIGSGLNTSYMIVPITIGSHNVTETYDWNSKQLIHGENGIGCLLVQAKGFRILYGWTWPIKSTVELVDQDRIILYLPIGGDSTLSTYVMVNNNSTKLDIRFKSTKNHKMMITPAFNVKRQCLI